MLRAAVLVLGLSLAATASADGVRRQLELPTNSLFDAQGLGAGTPRFALAAGFPFVQAVAGVGVGSAADLDLNVDTLYGAATQIGLGPKLRLVGDQGFAVAAALQGQWTAFRNAAFTEGTSSARHLTGLRNWGIQPSLIASSRGHGGTLYGVVQGQITYATEPELGAPLQGGGSAAWGGNLGLYVGGELNSGTALIHVYGLLGVDLHFRSTDMPALPRVEIGFTFPG